VTDDQVMDGIGRLGWVQVDSQDPVALAQFWGQVLGRAVTEPFGDPPHYVGLEPAAPGEQILSFHRVAEPKTVKNRVHLDVLVDDVEAATSRVETLGGWRFPAADYAEYGFRWRVMTDPEGNEFCLIYAQPD
jgi:predicted enzyme related to lactoylglutathione lyase